MPTRSRLLEKGDAVTFGGMLREARVKQKLTLARAAELVGTSASHLSRLERGERTALGRELLARLAATLAVDPPRLFAAAGLLPPTVERELADPDIALALVDGGRLPYRTKWMLRRRHLGLLAASKFQAPPAGRVDVEGPLRRLGFTVRPAAEAERRLRLEGQTIFVAADPPELKRLLLAHVLAHLALGDGPDCLLDSDERTPEQEDRESEATAMASFILVPTTTLAIAVRDEGSRYDVWEGQTGALLDALAGRFGAPAWIIARRIGEEGFFVDAAQLEDM